MSKRIISLTASLLCLVMLLAGCGSSQNASTNNASKGDRVVIYTAAEDERIAYIQEELNIHNLVYDHFFCRTFPLQNQWHPSAQDVAQFCRHQTGQFG